MAEPEPIQDLLAYLRGEASPDDVRAIERRLNHEPALRRLLLELSQEEVVLSEWARSEQIAVELDDMTLAPESPKANTRTRSLASKKRWITAKPLIAAAAAALALFVLAWLWIDRTRPSGSIPAGLAQLVASTDAEWRGLSPQLTEPLAAGTYHLQQGAIDLVFVDGAKVSLRGPASFELRSSRHLHVTTGNVVARIPEEALGFVVTSPQSTVVDLGTEFGLAVDEAGNTDVHVLEGLVEVADTRDPSGQGVLVEAGTAKRFVGKSSAVPVDIPLVSRVGLIGNGKVAQPGARMLRGSVRTVDALPKTAYTGTVTGPNRIEWITERRDVRLPKAITVTIDSPGNYRDYEGLASEIPAGTQLTSHLLHFRPGSKAPVFGVIRFDNPIVGILSTGEHLHRSDALFGISSVHYPKNENPFRGLEPASPATAKGRDDPSWQPDEIILSQDQRTIAIRTAANPERGVDQLRILTLSAP